MNTELSTLLATLNDTLPHVIEVMLFQAKLTLIGCVIFAVLVPCFLAVGWRLDTKYEIEGVGLRPIVCIVAVILAIPYTYTICQIVVIATNPHYWVIQQLIK
jgi:hypothetical protein